jgi:hypothetical protein
MLMIRGENPSSDGSPFVRSGLAAIQLDEVAAATHK